MSNFEFCGNDDEHFIINGPNFEDSASLPDGIKYITINKPLKGFILDRKSNDIKKVYVNINRAVGERMNYNLEKYECLIFSKSGFLKGDNLLFKGASYVIDHYSEFEDKNNFINNIKIDKVSTKQLYIDLVKDSKKIYTEFLIENNILTIEDCKNLLKEELNIENSLLLTKLLNSFSEEDIKEYNEQTVRKENLDIGIESYNIEDLKKIFDSEIKDDCIIVKKPKIVEEVIIFSPIAGVKNYSFKSMSSDKTIKRIIFEEGIENICAYEAKNIFTKLSELKEIYLPKSLIHIDDIILETLRKGVKVYSNNIVSDYAVVKNKLIHFNIERTQKNIIIPEGVETIRFELFKERPNSSFITFPTTMKTIGVNMFKHCTIKSINFNQPLVNNLVIEDGAFRYSRGIFEIPKGTIHIGSDAFSGNNNKIIRIPEGVITIGDNAFEQSLKVSTIELPSTLKSIGNHCFSECSSIKSIHIPKNVEKIGDRVFEKCVKLEEIEVDKENDFYTSIDGVLYNKDCTIIIACPANLKKEEYTILDSAKTIDKSAFSFSNLKKVNIPTSVILIDEGAFYNSKIIEIKIPNSVFNIKASAFFYCKSLINVKLSESIIELAKRAFYSCENLENVNLPNNLEVISKEVFFGCLKIKSINIPDSVKKIESRAFRNCPIEYLFIPKNVVVVEDFSLSISSSTIIEVEHKTKLDTWDEKFLGFERNLVKWGSKR